MTVSNKNIGDKILCRTAKGYYSIRRVCWFGIQYIENDIPKGRYMRKGSEAYKTIGKKMDKVIDICTKEGVNINEIYTVICIREASLNDSPLYDTVRVNQKELDNKI